MTADDKMTPGERRELRSILKKQFQVLRNDVKRREQELAGEIEAELLRRYRDQDDAVKDTTEELERCIEDFKIACEAVADSLRLRRPELTVSLRFQGDRVILHASDSQRKQERQALHAAIPQQVAAAASQLEQTELDLLRELTIGAITSEEAREFMGRIPTIGALVPVARLNELEAGK